MQTTHTREKARHELCLMRQSGPHMRPVAADAQRASDSVSQLRHETQGRSAGLRLDFGPRPPCLGLVAIVEAPGFWVLPIALAVVFCTAFVIPEAARSLRSRAALFMIAPQQNWERYADTN